ncbi:universal stress protein [Natribaculum luteum]|uniref:Universal stress protein n=1 Tax=Natribaculum luteum TaxID=1586232 RepID=A0ABD5P3F9_9EURY|nr:universal stress protein [Natribaculum luteum]
MRAVFATDLSEASTAAISTQACLECLNRIGIDEVHLVTVISSNVHYGMPGFDLDSQRRKALENQRAFFEEEGFDVEMHVVRGTPHRRINDVAKRVGADMIVVGSKGQSPLERRLIGSTARNVARTSVRPLLIERIVEEDDGHEVAREHLFQRVLYATDFSENADRAFDQFRVLKNATEEATLVHVSDREQQEAGISTEEARERLESMADDLESYGIDTTIDVREDEPVEGILAAEEEYDPTVILMGSRGQSRLRRLLIGSVSESVTARAKSNVLIVPPTQR